MLLKLYVENTGGSIASVNQKKVMDLLHDDQLMQDLIPREDAYYQEMLKNQKEANARLKRAMDNQARDEEEGDLLTGHLFNHPMLSYYN